MINSSQRSNGPLAASSVFGTPTASQDAPPDQSVHLPTLIGLVPLLQPIIAVIHEFGGHGVACLVSGGRLTGLGAYYVNCTSSSLLAQRAVALAGTGADVIVSCLTFLLWRRASSPLLRTAMWMTFVAKGMTAAGYPLYSGITGIGDWGPAGAGGLAPLPDPLLWRLLFTIVGGLAYVAVVRLAIASLRAMLGGGHETLRYQRQLPMVLYAVSGLSAVVVGMLNPVGIFITLTSAAAATLGGLAGLFPVAFRPPPQGEPRPFHVRRDVPVILAGVLTTAVFAFVLGPTFRFP